MKMVINTVITGMMAARSMITYLQGTKANDLIILLLSGGGSALLAAPIETITLQDLQKTTNELLACGATIHEMNTIRKHVSSIKVNIIQYLGWKFCPSCKPIKFSYTDIIRCCRGYLRCDRVRANNPRF